MRIEAKNMRVSIKDPKTGEVKEMPLGQLHISEFQPEQHEDGRYSYTAELNYKCRMTRRTRKQILRLFRPTRQPKYIAKSVYATQILKYAKDSSTYEQLMKLTAKKLHKRFATVIYEMIFRRSLHEASRIDGRVADMYPCGGIVQKPQVEFNVNTGEAVEKLNEVKKKLEDLENR